MVKHYIHNVRLWVQVLLDLVILMPQLDIATYMSQVIYLVIFLLIAYYILSLFIFQKIILILKFNIKKSKLFFNNIIFKNFKYNLLLLLLNKQIIEYLINTFVYLKNIISLQKVYIFNDIYNINNIEE